MMDHSPQCVPPHTQCPPDTCSAINSLPERHRMGLCLCSYSSSTFQLSLLHLCVGRLSDWREQARVGFLQELQAAGMAKAEVLRVWTCLGRTITITWEPVRKANSWNFQNQKLRD